MADKSEQEQIEAHEKEIAELKAKQEELRQKAARQEYPKWIPDVTDPTGQRGFTVQNEEEEKKAKAGQMVPPTSADQKLKSEEIRRKAREDEEAALALRDEADEYTRNKQGKAKNATVTTKVDGVPVTSTAVTDDAKAVGEGTVADAKTAIAAAANKRELSSIERAEKKREGGERQGVIDAIERRRAELDKE